MPSKTHADALLKSLNREVKRGKPTKRLQASSTSSWNLP